MDKTKVLIHILVFQLCQSSFLVLQHLLSSPNPPKGPLAVAQNAVQARLRNVCIVFLSKIHF